MIYEKMLSKIAGEVAIYYAKSYLFNGNFHKSIFLRALMENPYIWEHPYATSNSLWFTPASG